MAPCFMPIPNFNPRSREGSDVATLFSTPWTSDFNPRSREGSDIQARNQIQTLQISIHAPVKGATERGCPAGCGDPISIHAPVKGATQYSNGSTDRPRFQSTLP